MRTFEQINNCNEPLNNLCLQQKIRFTSHSNYIKKWNIGIFKESFTFWNVNSWYLNISVILTVGLTFYSFHTIALYRYISLYSLIHSFLFWINSKLETKAKYWNSIFVLQWCYNKYTTNLPFQRNHSTRK